MPEQSSFSAFINALKSKQTTITRALKRAFDERGSLDPAIAADIVAGTLDVAPLDSRVEGALGTRGCGAKELTHIGHWPAVEKEKVRDAVRTALQSDPVRDVTFAWDLTNGAKSEVQVDNLAGPGTIGITFLSPRANVRISTATAVSGEIFVDVDEEESSMMA